MKHSLQLKISQSLTMTPQLQQAIRLLQLSSLELHTEIQEALDSNMMLELAEDEPEAETANIETASANPETDAGPIELNDTVATNDSIPEDLPVDSAWEDIYDSNLYSYSKTQQPLEFYGLENQNRSETSLRDYLLWQSNFAVASDTDRTIIMAIIDALDDDGYLTSNPEDILTALGRDMDVEVDEIEAMIRLVQTLEPAGIAARNLQECLGLQLAQCNAATPWLIEATELVNNHLPLLAAHDYNQLMRRMKLSQEQLSEVVALIQSMNPRPGSQVQDIHIQYLTPDVFVRKIKGVWRVELNADSTPQLRINSGYAGMIKRADNSTDNNSMKTHLQEARWFIKSLQSRNETLLRVATAIVERQRAFLEYGDEAMKPLVLHDIATVLDLHESTISRVTTRKYMHTPRGIYELKYFFSSHVSTDLGGACSSTAIRALIKKLIGAEKPQKPLSDSKIAALLADQGIRVARRTVAKYREAMTIPPSNERKRLI
ncbi:MAG: RNA polymerase factor sigma-54 [Gammaproteobacteria bacterium RIFCSPLOWO2_12_FULL_52_10]|nr:MAG: RNA polymerase factor sigma-54 [Gammaproteobacteria bacterium RIFCSPLOWO2_12_FULL_52_10]